VPDILKFDKLVKKTGYSLQFFFWGRVEHTPFACKQPMFVYGKSAGN